MARSIPHRRFDWDTREWSAPATDWAALKVAGDARALSRAGGRRRRRRRGWPGSPRAGSAGRRRPATTDAAGGCCTTLAGPIPEELLAEARSSTRAAARPAHRRRPPQVAARPALGPPGRRRRALHARSSSTAVYPPPARLAWFRGVDGEQLRLEVMWDPDIGLAFEQLPGVRGHPRGPARPVGRRGARRVHRPPRGRGHRPRARGARAAAGRAPQAAGAVAPLPRHRGRADRAGGRALGGELAPFQWAAVRYALQARGSFLADEQGLGKTVEALAALEADGAYPAIVICPASMKLNWEREAERWLPHRSVAVIHGRVAVPPRGDITILNYEIVAAHRQALARPRAAGDRRRRVALLQEPQRQAHPGGAVAGRDGARPTACGWRSPAPRCSTTPTS